MPDPKQLALIVLLPAAIALVIGLVSWRIWRPGFERGYWGGPLAILIGFTMSFSRISGSKPWPIDETTTWLFYVAIVAGLIGLLDALVRLPVALRFVLSYAICFAMSATVLHFKVTNGTWSNGQFFATTSSLSIIGLMWWGAFERSGFRDRRINSPTSDRRSVVAPVLMWMVATAGALAMNDSATCSFCAANLAGISGALAVVSLLRPNVRWMRGTAFAFAPLMLSIVVTRHFLTPLSREQQVAISFPLMAVPVFILLGRLIAIPIPGHWVRVTVRLAVPAIPMVILMINGAIAIRHIEDDPYNESSFVWPSKTCVTTYSDGIEPAKRFKFGSTSVGAGTI
jgi:hypothetical protein